MDVEARILVAKILISEFGRLIGELDPRSDQMNVVLKKAHGTHLRMKLFHQKWDGPPELLEQIHLMESIIKKAENMQNKHVTDV